MLKNYFKIAFRNILRFKLYSFINILGLSVGIASFVLIFSYVYTETNYDTFQKNATSVYRINTVLKSPGPFKLMLSMMVVWMRSRTTKDRAPWWTNISSSS